MHLWLEIKAAVLCSHAEKFPTQQQQVMWGQHASTDTCIVK